MTTVICRNHAACELNCYHRTPHKHGECCITDTWGICRGECVTPEWATTDENPSSDQ